MLEQERNDDGSPIAQISTTQILQSVLINTHTHICVKSFNYVCSHTPYKCTRIRVYILNQLAKTLTHSSYRSIEAYI